MHFKEIGWESVDWIYLAWLRDQWQAVLNMVLKLFVPLSSPDFLTLYEYRLLKKDSAPFTRW
jgi:hypothetical protein